MNYKLERLVRVLYRYLKGRVWCLTFHAPVVRELGGYGGRDHLNRRRKAYHSIWCVKCNNGWDQADRGEKCIGSHVWHWRRSERNANKCFNLTPSVQVKQMTMATVADMKGQERWV